MGHMRARCSAYIGVKVHVVGDDMDVGVEHLALTDHLLQDVPHSR